MDVFGAPKVGSAAAIGSRYGNISGTSTDIIYPVSKLVNGQFQEGRTVEFNWKSDKHRHWHPRSTRLVHEFQFKFGEVDETCAAVTTGPATSAGTRPSKSVRFTALPGHALYGNGQARFVQNSVVLENQNHLYDASMVQLLTTQNIEGPSTSGSNMLTSLRKDTGLSTGILRGSQAPSESENFALLPVTPAAYAKNDMAAATYATLDSGDTIADAMRKLRAGGAAKTLTGLTLKTAVAKAAAPDTSKELTIVTTLSSDSATATEQVDLFDEIMAKKGSVTLGGGKNFTLPDGTQSNTAKIVDADLANSSVTDPAGQDLAIILRCAGPVTASGDITAGTTLTFSADDPDAANAKFNASNLTLTELAQLLTVKAKGDTYKATTPNPKCEILHMSLDSNNVVTVQVSEPIMLSTWQHNFAIGPSDYGLFLTVSPDWRKTLLFDHSGQYGCGSAGAIINGNDSSLEGLPTGSNVNARQIYCQVKSVELHVGYVHPSEPYIPPSQSIRYSPIQVTRRKVEGTSLAETFVVPPSTKSVMIFLEQDASHVCIDAELDSKAGAGINVLGSTDTAGTGDTTADRTGTQHAGTFLFDSNDIYASRDLSTDPRRVNTTSHSGVESTRPYALQSLQVQLGGQIQPREMLTEMDPRDGKMSRAWNLYTQFIGRSQGYRGSVMSYAEFCGRHSANYASGPGCGDRGSFFLFDMQQPPGSLATDLQVRGTFRGNIQTEAKQRIVVVAISDSIMNIGWQAPSETPVMTQVAPIVG
jgi:hypothetical protein